MNMVSSSIIASVIIEFSLSKICMIVIGLIASFSVSYLFAKILDKAGLIALIDGSFQSFGRSTCSSSSSSK